MSCEDDSGHFLHSDSLEFSTRHISSLRNRDSTHSGDNKSDYLTEMNLKLLPAISNSIQQETALGTIQILRKQTRWVGGLGQILTFAQQVVPKCAAKNFFTNCKESLES